MGTSVRNLKGKCNTVAKMCCLVQRAIFVVIKLKPHKLDFAGHCPIYGMFYAILMLVIIHT